MEKQTKVHYHVFFMEHKNGLLRPEAEELRKRIQREGMSSAINGGDGCVYISEEEMELLLACERDYEREEAEYREVSDLRLQGMEEDRRGETERAADSYERCIHRGENATHYMFCAYAYAYERLFVALRKLGRLEDEQRYIERYLLYGDRLSEHARETYTKRLETVRKKLTKQQQQKP